MKLRKKDVPKAACKQTVHAKRKGEMFAITTTRKPPPHHLPLFFLGFWGEFTTFLLAFLYIDEEVTSCSSRKKGKGPPEPEFTGEGTK